MAESQIRMALEKLSQTIASQPEKAKAKHSPATAILMTGVKCRVRGPAGEQIETDMPELRWEVLHQVQTRDGFSEPLSRHAARP